MAPTQQPAAPVNRETCDETRVLTRAQYEFLVARVSARRTARYLENLATTGGCTE